MVKYLFVMLSFCGFVACGSGAQQSSATDVQQSEKESKKEVKIKSKFNKDTAFAFLKKQCDFGPRVPNSAAQKACASYLAAELKRFGAEVTVQEAKVKAYDGTMLDMKNVIGCFQPEKQDRIIFFTHWDSRPYCDNDDNKDNHNKPVMAANDGASGTAVLLELARLMQQEAPNVGVDIVFLDVEDYGAPSFAKGQYKDDWCLGTQYWGAHPHYTYKPKYGILLDMVGGRDPLFAIDIVSQQYAGFVVNKVWSIAGSLGYGNTFVYREGGNIMDDHYYINKLTQIPTMDIIDFKEGRGFPDTWHTANDTPENIDPNTLQMVGDVVVTTVYRE
ncbi:MAG: M28 family peptidase [Paludibacteraceae bacterium]|nr:M28 family peptidase [Paludibacteraceae bacterium]